MTPREEQFFDALIKDREDISKTFQKPAVRGFWDIIIEKYSDQAHFVYELLQNADDAGATHAEFRLDDNELIFKHNGTRKFSITDLQSEEVDTENSSLGDINAITSIGNSNKLVENQVGNKIGKFGVGFKAVFRYTSAPEIFDGNFAFRLENFIVPIRLSYDHSERGKDGTLFRFPFNKKDCPLSQAFEEIATKLTALDCPILFLSHLKKITFDIKGAKGSYEKNFLTRKIFDDLTAEFVTLTQPAKDATQTSLFNERQNLWLFSRKDECGRKYSIGYFLDEKNQLTPVKKPAFCFFPTKHDTRLNFIIHAPFLLTASREGILAGEVHNKKMIELLAALAANALCYLRDIGKVWSDRLIDDNILKVIPTNESDFENTSRDQISFKPFFDTIRQTMQTEKILPTRNDYILRKNAYWAIPIRLTGIFSDEQLKTLVHDSAAAWVFTETSDRDSKVTTYIRSVVYKVLDEDNLLRLIDANFISRQPINWFHDFYKWLAETSRRIEIAKIKPFFLDTNNEATAAFDDNGRLKLFLPVSGDSGYTTIHPDLLANPETAKFLTEKIGLKQPSLKDEVYTKILPQYVSGSLNNEQYCFLKIFAYHKQCSRREQQNFIADFKPNVFFRALDKKYYHTNVLYFPEPKLVEYFAAAKNASKNPSQTLSKYFAACKAKFLNTDFYQTLVDAGDEKYLLNFFKELGVADEVRYLSQEFDERQAKSLKLKIPHSNYAVTWREEFIDGSVAILEAVVNNEDNAAKKSFLLWKRIVAVNQNVGKLKSKLIGRCEYFYYKDNVVSYTPVVNVQFLCESAWLVDKAGNFKKPADITVAEMADEYDVTSDSAREVIAFFDIPKRKAEDDRLTEDEKRLIDKARKLEAAGISDEDLERFILQKTATTQPPSTTTTNDTTSTTTNDTNSTPQPQPPPPKKISPKKIQPPPPPPPTPQPQPSNELEDNIDYDKMLTRAQKKFDDEKKRIDDLKNLQQKVQGGRKYSFGWCKTLLDLEILNSSEKKSNSKEISITFGQAEEVTGTQRTLLLKYPNRYIPQFIEDLENIPLELQTATETRNVEIEVAAVRNYTLSVKLKDKSKLDGINLADVKAATITAKNPVFLLEELKNQFDALGFDDAYNMRDNLCKNIEFVFGPPGTGKTHTLAKKIIALMSDPADKKILVMTPTNKAADVLVSKIMELDTSKAYADWLLRFGTTNDVNIEASGVFKDKRFDINSQRKNVTVTTIARFPYDFFITSGVGNLRDIAWDYIIIDEASMIMLAQILLPLYKQTPKKFIVAGDPFQIEPVTAVDLWQKENIYTLVGLNSFTTPKTVHDYRVECLTKQYRSVPAVGEIFSRFTYGGILQHARAAASQRPLNLGDWLDGMKTLNIIKFPVDNYESIYRPKRLNGASSYHIYSALFTFEFVNKLREQLEEKNPDENFSIGIVAPYRAQADLIQKLFAAIALTKKFGRVDIQVGTVHTFQGDECDILFAVFNTPPTISSSEKMFLNRQNIINVAISRAKDYLFLVMPDDKTKNIENLKLVNEVVNYFAAETNSGQFAAHDLEESIFGNPNYIEENSFATGHQNVNVYNKPERQYEIRSEENAVDVQLH